MQGNDAFVTGFEGDDGHDASVEFDDNPGGSIDVGDGEGRTSAGERIGERHRDDWCAVLSDDRGTGDRATGIELADYLGVEHGEEFVEVAAGASDCELLSYSSRSGGGGREAGLGIAGDVAARSAGELTARGGGTSDNFGDLFERQREDVVEYEHCAFEGRERFEDHEQCHPDTVIEGDPVGRINGGAWYVDKRFGQPRADVTSPARVGSEPVEADSTGRCDQPTEHVIDPAGAVAGESGEGFLEDVFGVGQRPEHPVGDIEHPLSVLDPRSNHCLIRRVRGLERNHGLEDGSRGPTVTSVARCHSSRRPPVLDGMNSITSKPSSLTIPRPEWLPENVWPFAIHTMAVHGHRVAYTDVGTGPTLLFSHAGQWSILWRDVIAKLSDRFRCVAFDPLGSGLSDRVPAALQTLDAVRDVVGALIDHLDLRDVTVVMHDLGGVSALAAMSTRLDRLGGIAAVNTFGWRPSGIMFRPMLLIIGGAPMRELDAFTGFLPKATSRRFGVGRHWNRPTRKAFRYGLRDHQARRAMHRLFHDARVNATIYAQASRTIDALNPRQALTIFGSLGDYLGFQRKWRSALPGITQTSIPWGLHFPMCDNPSLTAKHLADWHQATFPAS